MVIAVLLQADRLALERPWRGWYFADGLTITMSIGENDWRKVERELRAYVVVGGFGVQEGSRSSAVWDFAAMGARFLREWEQEEAIF